MEATLLVELLTEELPPKSLARLGNAFAQGVLAGLAAQQLKGGATDQRVFATPRRLGVLIPQVSAKAADREKVETGPSDKAPAAAIAGFARKHGVAVEALERQETPKGAVVAARVKIAGAALDDVLAAIVAEALKKLPIPKVMRWGDGEAQFVRPAHKLVMMHGSHVVPGSVLGLESGNSTRGHRFMASGEIKLSAADEYEARLKRDGRVIPDFTERKAMIDAALKARAAESAADLGNYADLLDEVTALVECPAVYVGEFESRFLEVPQECLILTMRQNQKYFPLFDRAGRLLPKFLIVSNMDIADPSHIVNGNQRVVRPRLEDARFFYDQDRKSRLESRVPQLGQVVYHNKLGTQLERTLRIQLLAGKIARKLDADASLAERAAWLAKADLLTGMVGEFPELQGTMGRYYALHDGEPAEVANAIEAHYCPRFAGDRLPQGPVAAAVALADKLDTLAGLFGIGQHPTGDKDPFGLRRSALGVARILMEHKLALRLDELIGEAFEGYAGKVGEANTDLQIFMSDRIRSYFLDAKYSANEIEAVLSISPQRVDLIPRQLEAVRAFASMPESSSLAAANKRVVNILKQAAAKGESFANVEEGDLAEPAELALHQAIRSTSKSANEQFDQGDYAGYLKSFAVLRIPVDSFFESVMVMVDDEKVRRGRLALLADLRSAMNRVADLSKLAA
jgi:glycyl-tRNA synthetase beta chain